MEFQTTRALVIEKGVALEASISSLIGMLLDIDVDNSLSLGNKNSSLSLNSKVNLLSDLKYIPKEIAWQLQTFAEIRNKFAHVHSVDSFVKCFEILHEKKNRFLKTFEDKLNKEDEEEVNLSISFTILCISIGGWLQFVLEKTSFQKNQDLKRNTAIEVMRQFFTISEQQKENGKDYLQLAKNLIKEIEVDEEFYKTIDIVKSLDLEIESE